MDVAKQGSSMPETSCKGICKGTFIVYSSGVEKFRKTRNFTVETMNEGKVRGFFLGHADS